MTTDYADLVSKITTWLTTAKLDEEIQKWYDAFSYSGFNPLEIAKQMKNIDPKDLVMLCVLAVMRGTKIDKILAHTDDSDAIRRVKDLKAKYSIVDTGGPRSRTTITLSRIIAAFPLTTLAAASYMTESQMGIYHAACPKCPWLGLAGAVMIARLNSDKKASGSIMLGHVVVSALVTWKATGKTGKEIVERAVNYTNIVNNSTIYDYSASTYIKDTMYNALANFSSSEDLKSLATMADIDMSSIPSIKPNPLIKP